MTGFLTLAIIALASLGALWLVGLRSGMLTMAGAAIMLGAAGYAWQGRPALTGAPAQAGATPPPLPLDKARESFMGKFNAYDHWLIMADSQLARGETAKAAGLLRSAVREHPNDYGLWVGLGNALADHARGITPASRYAFARAKQIAPNAPAPDYFLGLALLRSGQPDEALVIWKDLLERAPERAQWRPLVEQGVALIEQAQAPRR